MRIGKLLLLAAATIGLLFTVSKLDQARRRLLRKRTCTKKEEIEVIDNNHPVSNVCIVTESQTDPEPQKVEAIKERLDIIDVQKLGKNLHLLESELNILKHRKN
jgi:glycerol-3-phosphate cytidylyltransferase-like family protein